MMLLYSLLLLVLGLIKFVIDRRVANLERRYSRAAREVDRMLFGEKLLREGNSSRLDTLQSAKRQYLLGQMVLRRDRLEASHDRWLERAEKFGRFVARVRDWKGRKLPYTLGLVDMGLLLYLIDWCGVGHYVTLANIVNLVRSFLFNE